jgi:hypothetical protein
MESYVFNQIQIESLIQHSLKLFKKMRKEALQILLTTDGPLIRQQKEAEISQFQPLPAM